METSWWYLMANCYVRIVLLADKGPSSFAFGL
jgi:hypothetical protein